MSAAVRAAERNAERRRKQYAKEQMISDASDAVSEWQSAIHELVSLHADPADEIDWPRELRKPEPSEPGRSAAHELQAQGRLDGFKPRFWDFLFGGSDKRLEKLKEAVQSGRVQDDENYGAAIEVYEVYVTCVTTMLNTKTGHQEATPILSVRFVRETFRRLDRRHIDPSDCMRNFVHEMDFKRTRGFARIAPLQTLEEV
jgi:hypothetical protein